MSKTFFPQGFKSDEDKAAKDEVSELFAKVEECLLEKFPEGRERSAALEHLETAAMWATKSLTHTPRVEPCDKCPHPRHLHNPDGSCGCGSDCGNK